MEAATFAVAMTWAMLLPSADDSRDGGMCSTNHSQY